MPRTKSTELTETLKTTVDYLKNGGGTVSEMADHFGVSVPAIYARIKTLQNDHGYQLKASPVKVEGRKGPPAKSFSLPR